MFSVLSEFANVLLAALTVGSMFCVWLVFNPAGLNANAYVILQQQGIRTLNRALPAFGAATVIVTLAAAVLGRDNSTRFGLLIAAVLCFLAAGFITRLRNQPINLLVMKWRSDSPPANWTELRDKWYFDRQFPCSGTLRPGS
jgi:hypothetical protein